MPNIEPLLTPSRVRLDELLLDPNNPRFLDLDGETGNVPEARFNEPAVQRTTFERLKDRRFDLASLKDTIKMVGFLTIDRIVVRKWADSDDYRRRYVVLEGNRRVAALKWLLELNDEGREQLTPEQVESFSALDVLILRDGTDPSVGRWVIPGLRHVSGVKPWGAYQQAVAVKTLRMEGMTPQDAAKSIGLSTRAANSLWRAYWALDQMRNDEDYGLSADEKHFSYFDELLGKPVLREWFGWDDNEKRFTQSEKIREFYSWIVGAPGEDGGEQQEPKIVMAIDVRRLEEVTQEPRALAVLRGAGKTLEDAVATFKAIHPDDWRSYVASADSLLGSLSPDALRALTPSDLDALGGLRARLDQVISDRERLLRT